MAEEDDDDDLGLETNTGTVPYSRFSKVAYQRKEARGARDTALAEVATLRATLAERDASIEGFGATTTELETLRAAEMGWATEKAIMGAGINDAEGVEFAQMAYSRLPAEGRPKLTEWLGEENRENLPRGLQAYFGAAEEKPGAKTVDPNKGAKGYNGKTDNNFSSEFSQGKTSRESLNARYAELGLPVPAWAQPKG